MDSKTPIDTDSNDDAALALLLLGVCDANRVSGQVGVWKSFDWAAMNRPHEKGLIHNDPVGTAGRGIELSVS